MSEPYLTRVGDAADLAAEALAPYFDMKFAFFGHSLGALIAYELAQRLRHKGGAQPRHLIVSAHRAPQLPFPLDPTWNLPGDDLKRRLEKLAGTPKEVLQHEELLQLMMPLIRADFRLDETYTHPVDYEPLDCPITAFGGRQDSETSEADLRAWGEVTRGSFELRMMDGDHFFIHSQADALVREVARLLQNPR
jgi:medium-chain acyl-[acyl-carrier-protein] hydrolase